MLATVPPIKTPLGQQELRRRTGGLGQRHRTLLFLIDGRRPLSEVLVLGHKAGAATSHLEDLIRLGFVDVPALHPPEAPPVPMFAEVPAQVTYVEMEIPAGPLHSQWGTLDAEMPVPVVKVFDEPVPEEAVADDAAIVAMAPAPDAFDADGIGADPSSTFAQASADGEEAALVAMAQPISTPALPDEPEPELEPMAALAGEALAEPADETKLAPEPEPEPEPLPLPPLPWESQPAPSELAVGREDRPTAVLTDVPTGDPLSKPARTPSALLPLEFPPEQAFTSTLAAPVAAPPMAAPTTPAAPERRPLPAVLQRMAMLARRPPARPKDPVDEARDCLLRVIKLDRTTMARRLRPRVVNAKTEGTLIDVVWELERDLTHGQRSHEGLIALQRARELLQLGNTLVDEAIDASGMLHG